MSRSPSEALADSRVDLIDTIERGIPEREYVPGAKGLLPKGKRIHVAAEKKTGKSISFGIVQAVATVAAGGTVAVLDRENGWEEYARRLQDVLDARDADAALRQHVSDRYRYYAWPALALEWRDDSTYHAAFENVDLIIFDSSRAHLTGLGLKEDTADDYSLFMTVFVDPLMRMGATVVVLDNTGHAEKGRARGTSAKEDLCDIAFTLVTITAFSVAKRGRLELRCIASRLGDVGDKWEMELGGGTYRPWRPIGPRPPEKREDLREAVIEVLAAADCPLGQNKVAVAIRRRPENELHFSNEDLGRALKAWAADPASGIVAAPGGGFTVHADAARHGGHADGIAARPGTTLRHTPEDGAAEPHCAMPNDGGIDQQVAHAGSVPPYTGAPPAAGPTRPLAAQEGGGGEGGDEGDVWGDPLPDGWTDDDLQAVVDAEASRIDSERGASG